MKRINAVIGDTKIIEIISAVALFCSAIMFLPPFQIPSNAYYLNFHPYQFWCISLGTVSLLQMYSLLRPMGLELLRVLIAWAAGSIWVFFSISSFSDHVDITHLPAFLLGLANLYAFCINSLIINKIRNVWAN